MDKQQQITLVIRDAWQNKNLDLLRNHLAENIEWYEGPFEEAITNPEAVITQWEGDLAKQNDLKVEVGLLDTIGGRSYLQCAATWKDLDTILHDINGILVVHLDGDGRITYFNQWWSSR